MHIIVLIKQVPDASEVKINRETNTLIRDGVPSIINPFDMFAIEEALRLREQHGGKVTAMTMGPPQAAEALKDEGAIEVTVCCTHPVLSGPAIERIEQSGLKEVIVTDTVPLHARAKACSRIKVLSVSGLLSEAVRRIYYNDSVSSLFI